MKFKTELLIFSLIISSVCFTSCKKEETLSPAISYYNISGKVYQAEDTTEYLPNVIVTSGNIIDTTDQFGRFELKQVPSGKLTVSFHLNDFKTLDTVINLQNNMTLLAGLKRAQTDIFPNETGYSWTYVVFDSSYAFPVSIDTATVKIIGNGSLPDGRKAKIWHYDYKTFDVTDYPVALINDTVIFDNHTEYVFPLSIGKKWMPQSFRTTEVQAIENVQTLAGLIPNCYRLFSEEFGDHYHYRRTYWFAPRIGTVKEIYMVSNFGSFYYATWILLDYKLE